MVIQDTYFKKLAKLLKSPGTFFEKLPQDSNFSQPLIFLLISSFISTIIFIFSTSFESFMLTGLIYYTNAVGMTFITAIAGFITIKLFLRSSTNFKKCFTIFSYATGLSVISAGIPFLLWFAEIWKWSLIATGLKRNLGFQSLSIFIVISVSIFIVYIFFNTILTTIPFPK